MSGSAERLSIVVPVYNEVRTVRAVLDRLLQIRFSIPHEVIVVDDGSTDGTGDVLRIAAGERMPVTLIHAERNAGKGSAIRAGLARATGTILAIQDADLELDPKQLGDLIEPILDGRAAVVYGSRFLSGRGGAPWITVAANRLLTGLTNALYGASITDMETCYKVTRVDVARSLGLTSDRFDIEPEITAKLLRAGHVIHERPIRFDPRSRAQGKKIGWRDGVRAVAVLLRHAGARRLAAIAAAVGAATLAGTAFAVGVTQGTHAVGGSDASCYALQAERWAAMRLQEPEPLALAAPWPAASATFAPAGHRASPTVDGAAVPICPAGLSIAMAGFLLAGGRDAIFLVVPLFGAVLVWATWAVGRRVGAHVGLAAAAVAGSSPIFLFQLVQPMSDVPAAALWTLAVACALRPHGVRAAAGAGLAASGAALVRPNLLPLGFAIGAFLLLRPGEAWRARTRAAAAFAAAVVPGCVALAAIQHAFYGSPVASGYGPIDALFSTAHVGPNARQYWTWLVETHTPAVLLAIAGGVVLRRVWVLPAVVAVNVALYLPYLVFRPDEWPYLRFLLPSIPLIAVMMMAAVDALAARVTPRLAPVAAAAAAAVVGVHMVGAARDRHAFRLDRIDARYARGGSFVARRLPPNAVVFTGSHSGSVRFYARRPTVAWDELDPAWLERALAFVRERGLEPYVLLESGEETLFRGRFGAGGAAAVATPPVAEIAGGVRVYRPADGEHTGESMIVRTEYVR